MKEPKIALLVGINKYPKESMLPQLRQAVSDASGLKDELAKQGYTTTEILIDEHATRRAILNQLDDLLSGLERGKGTFIFAFSGHGAQNAAGEPMLATWEVATNHMEEWLKVAEIQNRIAKSPVGRAMMFLDACRDMTPPEAPQGKRDVVLAPQKMTLAKLAESRGVRILFSGGDGKSVTEDPTLGHGYFSNFLIKALHEVRDPDGLLRFEKLSQFVKENVAEATEHRQQPDEPPTVASGNPWVVGQMAARRAFVVGINQYKFTEPSVDKTNSLEIVHTLKGAVSDASLMEALLKTAGFEVTRTPDAIQTADLKTEFEKFAARLLPSDIALFYFAGEGAMQDQEAYALASDARLAAPDVTRQEVQARTGRGSVADQLAISHVLEAMSKRAAGERTGPNIIITDMCLYRNSGDNHLNDAILKAENALVLFATSPGGFAYEKPSGGIMTLRLMSSLQDGASITAAYGLAMGQVMQETDRQQILTPIDHLDDSARKLIFAAARK